MHPTVTDLRFIRNVLVKALILFIAANLAFAACYPMPVLGRISAYNHLFPGRLRLPYGDNPDRAYNLSLFNLQAMFASHEIAAGPKPFNEYRVILIGDSSTWGFLLPANQTLSAQMNQLLLSNKPIFPSEKYIRVYNLGYPVMSLTKDLLILQQALSYQPDLIIWLFTLESFPNDKQLYPPLLQNNPQAVRNLINTYSLNIDPQSPELVDLTYWDRTIVGARRPLADLLRLQIYGALWAATGIDQDIPDSYEPRLEDLSAETNFHSLQPPHLDETLLAFDVITAGVQMAAGSTSILLVNEPIFVSQGKNSHIRYNFFYPRWAYDDYRQMMKTKSIANHWHYLDLWDAAENTEFTNSAVHLTSAGTQQLAQHLIQTILDLSNIQ